MYENHQNPPPPTSPESEKRSLWVFELPTGQFGQFVATTVGGGRCVFISVLLQQDLTPWGPGGPGTHCCRLG